MPEPDSASQRLTTGFRVPAETLPRIGVARREGRQRVIALEPIEAGTTILEVDGIYTERPSACSLQVGAAIHVEPPAGIDLECDQDRYHWRFLGHCCEPNAAFRGERLVAIRDIEPWEQIAINYNSTELELVAPFACTCGHCDGRMIRGYRHLDDAERARIAPIAAAYLRGGG